MFLREYFCIASIFFFCLRIQAQQELNQGEIKIAFMADVHLLDVWGTMKDIGYNGLLNPKTGKHALIRSMNAQLHSTRLFNENYFAFKAALDDAVERGVKIIALPGDFSDDGQPINIRGLNKILNQYSEEYRIAFFLITGNHDPTRPFGDEGGKIDFLGEGGKAQPIMSKQGMYTVDLKKEHPVLTSKEVRELGYEEIVNGLKLHGFFPKNNYLYWETPFSDYRYEDYSLEKATEASLFENRTYQQDSNVISLPDVSYLVEPVEGLWLMALDANVYIPKENASQYYGSGIGYNEVLKYKKHLVSWTRKIAEEAKRLNKTLLSFSHYPMVDFNNGASEEIKVLFGEKGLQSHRVPDEEVAEVFADAGLKIHFGGHMHLNDIGVHTSASGNTLTNVQVPSLAAYKPAYTIASIRPLGAIKLMTAVLDTIPEFDSFFKFYQEEHSYLQSLRKQPLWNSEILSSTNYMSFAGWHLKELIRLRFIKEWPKKLKKLLYSLNGSELYILLHGAYEFTEADIAENLENIGRTRGWKNAVVVANKKLENEGLRLQDLTVWNGSDLIHDFYRLRSADNYALSDIGEERIKQYTSFFKEKDVFQENEYLKEIELFFEIFSKVMKGSNYDDFTLKY